MIYKGIEIDCLGHSSFMIKKGEDVIYIDPYKLDDGCEKGNLILVSHEHYDHCSPSDIDKITDGKSLVLTPQGAADKLSGNVRVVSYGEKIELGGVVVEVVVAYNRDKTFHPLGLGVGFIVNIGGVRIYHAGDTDLISEMKELGEIDIALLPVSGVYTMNGEEAAEATEWIKPKLAIPMHYGAIVGSETDAEIFEEQADCEVKILCKKLCKPGECEARAEE